jgi:hypothetical protein
VWPHGSRKKKLIVAFHFQFSNQAGWKCDSCRQSGLEFKRRCGWIPAALDTPPKIVWARREVSTDECPTSTISAQSITWIEQYYVWRRLGPSYPGELSPREIEAFLILDREAQTEASHGAK